MSLGIFIAIVGGGSALLAYALLERRINQRACPYCGFRVSVDAVEQHCPRCNQTLWSNELEDRRRTAPNDSRQVPASRRANRQQAPTIFAQAEDGPTEFGPQTGE